MGRMFPFITKTCNPMAGGFYNTPEGKIVACPYECSYCWARALINKNQMKKYTGPYRVEPKELKRIFKPEDFVFVQDMSDIGAPTVDKRVVFDILSWVGSQPCLMLLLTKNPAFYNKYLNYLPPNTVLGVTIESDLPGVRRFSKAPPPEDRLNEMRKLGMRLKALWRPRKLFVSIEPIMQFSDEFAAQIRTFKPWGVAVGYDNYKNGLPEPSLAETEALIAALAEFSVVYRKTIRESTSSKVRRSEA